MARVRLARQAGVEAVRIFAEQGEEGLRSFFDREAREFSFEELVRWARRNQEDDNEDSD